MGLLEMENGPFRSDRAWLPEINGHEHEERAGIKAGPFLHKSGNAQGYFLATEAKENGAFPGSRDLCSLLDLAAEYLGEVAGEGVKGPGGVAR